MCVCVGPCGRCMIPTLIPDIRSPRAFSRNGYRGSQVRRGTNDRKQLLNLGPVHLMNKEKEKIMKHREEQDNFLN